MEQWKEVSLKPSSQGREDFRRDAVTVSEPCAGQQGPPGLLSRTVPGGPQGFPRVCVCPLRILALHVRPR